MLSLFFFFLRKIAKHFVTLRTAKVFGFGNKERKKYVFDKVVSSFEEELAMNLVQTRKQTQSMQANEAKIKRWTKNCTLNSVTLCTV